MKGPQIREVKLVLNYTDGRGQRRKKTITLPSAKRISAKLFYVVEETREFDIPIEFDDGTIADFFAAVNLAEGKIEIPGHIHESFETCAICQKLAKETEV